MRATALLVAAVLGTGCRGGYNQSQMSRLTPSEKALVGKYEMKSDYTPATPGANTAELRELLELLAALEGGKTTLECLPDKTFAMMVGETSVRGSWNLDKAELRLKIEEVGSMKPEQIAKVELKNRGVSGWSMSPEQREEFLAAYRNSAALERAESVARLRVGADGTLYSDGGPSDSVFGSMVSYFAKQPKD